MGQARPNTPLIRVNLCLSAARMTSSGRRWTPSPYILRRYSSCFPHLPCQAAQIPALPGYPSVGQCHIRRSSFCKNIMSRNVLEKDHFQHSDDPIGLVYRCDLEGDHASLLNLARHETRIERAMYRALHELERAQIRRRSRHVPASAAGETGLVHSSSSTRPRR